MPKVLQTCPKSGPKVTQNDAKNGAGTRCSKKYSQNTILSTYLKIQNIKSSKSTRFYNVFLKYTFCMLEAVRVTKWAKKRSKTHLNPDKNTSKTESKYRHSFYHQKVLKMTSESTPKEPPKGAKTRQISIQLGMGVPGGGPGPPRDPKWPHFGPQKCTFSHNSGPWCCYLASFKCILYKMHSKC